MPFNPMSWHDGQQFKVVFIVRELVKNIEILTMVPTKSGPRLKNRPNHGDNAIRTSPPTIKPEPSSRPPPKGSFNK